MSTNYVCEYCARSFTIDDDNTPPHAITTNTQHNNFSVLCDNCFSGFVVCDACGESMSQSNTYPACGSDSTVNVRVCSLCRRSLSRCDNCGRTLTPHAESIAVLGGYSSSVVCRHCLDNDYSLCGFCGGYFRRQRRFINGVEANDICSGCARRHYRNCEFCGNYFTSENVQTVDNRTYCNDCVTSHALTCDDCGSIMFDTNTTSDGDNVCSNCANTRYFWCDDCDALTPRNHRHACMRNYSFKPNPIFHGKERNGLFYGLEVEAESCNGADCRDVARDIVEKFSDNESLFYVKSDGSLNDGLEVVTHPQTITKIIKSDFLPKVLNHLDACGFKSHDTTTCGLHVHMSKNAFIDDMHQTRFAWFVYESKYTVPVARRSFNSYCRKVTKNLDTHTPDNTSSTRYEAVNFENYNTVEVRIFKGTLKATTIYITLLYLDAIFHYTESVRLPILASAGRDDDFMRFIKHKPKYGKLFYFLSNLS